jgi:hypothetical protein
MVREAYGGGVVMRVSKGRYESVITGKSRRVEVYVTVANEICIHVVGSVVDGSGGEDYEEKTTIEAQEAITLATELVRLAKRIRADDVDEFKREAK